MLSSAKPVADNQPVVERDSSDQSSNLLCRTLKPLSSKGFFAEFQNSAKNVPMKWITYKPPKLVKGDTRWYVEFYYRIPPELALHYKNKEWKRFRIFKDINRVKTDEYAHMLLNAVNYMLIDGFNPFKHQLNAMIAATGGKRIEWTAEEAFENFFEKWRKRDLESVSLYKYQRIHKALRSFIGDDWDSLNIRDIDANTAESFMYDAKTNQGWSNATFNNNLGFARTIFKHFENQKMIHANPFSQIDHLKEDVKMHRAYDNETMKKVIEYAREKDPYLELAILFTYYLCVRSDRELSNLKVKDISRERMQVFLRASASKTNADRYIPMPAALLKELDRRKTLRANSEFYIISPSSAKKQERQGLPGPKRFEKTFLSRRFIRLRKVLELPPEYTLYGFKHTRIIHMKLDGATDAEIMTLTGHKDYTAFAKYLRDLGANFDRKEFNAKTRVI
jgi:site-specific recombinase XerD